MPTKLKIGVCPLVLNEARAVLANEPALQGVEAFAFSNSCAQFHHTWDFLRPIMEQAERDDEFVLIGSTCLAKQGPIPDDFPKTRLHLLQRCLDFSADQALQDVLMANGAYMMTPGWALDWPARMREWGMDETMLAAFFNESSKRFAMLDTGIYPNAKEALKTFASLVGLPFETVPVGLATVKRILMEIVLAWRLEHANADLKNSQFAKRKMHEYAMVYDVLLQLSESRSEDHIAEKILELSEMLFAPAQVFYLPLPEENPHAQPVVRPFGSELAPELVRAFANWAKSESDEQIYQNGLAIRFGPKGSVYAALAVLDVGFPRFLEEYRAFAGTIGTVGTLAIRSVRAFERLNKVVDDLQISLQERNRLLADLVTARENAERANTAKSAFLSVMSHEIRTPLNAVLGFADILAETQLNEEQKEFAQIIKNRGADLLHLINQILDLSRVESGREDQQQELFSISAVMDAAKETVELTAQKKNLQLSIARTSDVPDSLFGCSECLRQIFVNLLGNAVKFTEQGGVSLDISRKEPAMEGSAPERITLCIVVKDTGPGIPKNRQTEIFEPFVQADSGIRKRHGGSGLGLAIVRRLVQNMGGAIALQSEEGKGTSFILSLPFALSAK